MTERQQKLAILGRYLEMCVSIADDLDYDGMAENLDNCKQFSYDELAEDYCTR